MCLAALTARDWALLSLAALGLLTFQPQPVGHWSMRERYPSRRVYLWEAWKRLALVVPAPIRADCRAVLRIARRFRALARWTDAERARRRALERGEHRVEPRLSEEG